MKTSISLAAVRTPTPFVKTISEGLVRTQIAQTTALSLWINGQSSNNSRFMTMVQKCMFRGRKFRTCDMDWSKLEQSEIMTIVQSCMLKSHEPVIIGML